jgi:agmatine deiminase
LTRFFKVEQYPQLILHIELNLIKPSHIGFKLPAEWYPHDATLMHWPSNRETWPGNRLEKAEIVFLKIIETLSRYEPVILLCDPLAVRRAEALLKKSEADPDRIHILEIKINDVWARDCGPICIIRNMNGSVDYAMTDWEYNAWGGKYPPFDDDNKIPSFLAEKFQMKSFQPGIVLEGGSIETNGNGLLLTTESVLQNPNRNKGLDKKDIERYLSDYFGIEKVIWLKKGLAGDDTDGHIDDLCRFVNEDTVLVSIVHNPADINYPALTENLSILKSASDQNGKPLNIIEIPLPETKIEDATVDGSEYVPASYANFYIANGVVLVPLYDKRYDDHAMNMIGKYFPYRDLTGINCTDLVWGQGSIHCVTQQLYGINF